MLRETIVLFALLSIIHARAHDHARAHALHKCEVIFGSSMEGWPRACLFSAHIYSRDSHKTRLSHAWMPVYVHVDTHACSFTACLIKGSTRCCLLYTLKCLARMYQSRKTLNFAFFPPPQRCQKCHELCSCASAFGVCSRPWTWWMGKNCWYAIRVWSTAPILHCLSTYVLMDSRKQGYVFYSALNLDGRAKFISARDSQGILVRALSYRIHAQKCAHRQCTILQIDSVSSSGFTLWEHSRAQTIQHEHTHSPYGILMRETAMYQCTA